MATLLCSLKRLGFVTGCIILIFARSAHAEPSISVDELRKGDSGKAVEVLISALKKQGLLLRQSLQSGLARSAAQSPGADQDTYDDSVQSAIKRTNFRNQIDLMLTFFERVQGETKQFINAIASAVTPWFQK